MSTEDKIVLFKSTFRDEYKRLLLTALSAPTGTYFYTYYKRGHPSPDLIREANKSPSSFIGKKATLIFVNIKENEKLKFYPLRDFTILEIKIDGALEFHFSPNEYYKYTQTELKNFNKMITEEMEILPPNQSSWAQFFSLHCLNKLQKSSDHHTWEKLVKYLDNDDIGKNDDFKDSVFYRLDHLKEAKTGLDIVYSHENGYLLTSNKRYEWGGFFFKPRETNESFEVKLEGSKNIEIITDRVIIHPGKNKPFKFEFSCKPIYYDKDLKIRIFTPQKDLDGDAPQHEIPIRIAKINFLKRIGWEGFAVLAGLIITSVAQTFIPIPWIKLIFSTIGNFLVLFGILMWKRKD